MKRLAIPIMLTSCIAGTALAQTQATVVRSTELKAKPFSDAETVKSLNENDKLGVLSRKASWTEVKAQDSSGWVKMLSIRFEGGDLNTKANDNVLSGLANLAKGSSSGSTTTTAVKGWDKETFKNLSPNQDRLQKAIGFAVTKSDAKTFAAQQELSDQDQAYVKADGSK